MFTISVDLAQLIGFVSHFSSFAISEVVYFEVETGSLFIAKCCPLPMVPLIMTLMNRRFGKLPFILIESRQEFPTFYPGLSIYRVRFAGLTYARLPGLDDSTIESGSSGQANECFAMCWRQHYREKAIAGRLFIERTTFFN